MCYSAKNGPWIDPCRNNTDLVGYDWCHDPETAQLTLLARSATAEARARYHHMQEVMKQDVPDASDTDAMNNQIIVKLRGEYLSLAGRMVIYSQRYGSDHLAVIALRTQMRELQIRTQ